MKEEKVVEKHLLKINSIGYVLPGGIGRLDGNFESSALPVTKGDALANFNVRPYLGSVKGYLDPGAAYLLAASSLALEKEQKDKASIRDDAGIATLTVYGAPQSGSRFFSQFLEKGARYASPLLFPHSYANTAGNLAAIEYGFGGPHLVLWGKNDVQELFYFAAMRLQESSATEMLVGVYEAIDATAVADGIHAVNGAVALHLTAPTSDVSDRTVITADHLERLLPPSQDSGSVSNMLHFFQMLTSF